MILIGTVNYHNNYTSVGTVNPAATNNNIEWFFILALLQLQKWKN